VADLGEAQPQRGNLDKLVRKVAEERGIDLAQYRRSYVERRIAARLRALGLVTYRQYADRLDRDPDEYGRFLQVLTINVTDFFRDPEMWDVLRESVVPQLAQAKKRRRGTTLRVWSAGCATGEEAYSLAMTLVDGLGDERDRFTISIQATDIDPETLEAARRGTYAAEKVEHIPLRLRERFTAPGPNNEPSDFQISPDIRRLVHFQAFSLFDSPPMKLVDLVMCRNVFIYFDRAQQARILDGFWSAMSPGAYLVLGRSEKLTVDAYARFETIDSRERIYQKMVGS
jgi:chemotaxis methyl-accepting protein methylase